jgi:hypothetical protein
MATPELHTAPPEHESRGHENALLSPERIGGQGSGLLDRFFGGAADEAQTGGAMQLLRSPSFSEPANRSVRATAIKHAQQTYGNRFAQRALNGRLIQRRGSLGGTSTKCLSEEESPARSTGEPAKEPARVVQRQHASSSSIIHVQAHAAIPSGSGEPMAEGTRRFMESRFGADFSDVRVHTDSETAASAEALQAEAYTSGRDIYFAQGRYSPETRESQHLLAHELAHTVQQSGVPAQTQTVMRTSETVMLGAVDDPLEREADRAADEVVNRNGALSCLTTTPAKRSTVQRQAAPTDGPKAEKTRVTLPEGENIGFLADGTIVVRSAWWLEGATTEPDPDKRGSVKMHNAKRYLDILQAMKAAGYYSWMTESQMTKVSEEFVIEGKPIDTRDNFFTMKWSSTLLRVIGPPPGLEFWFVRSGSDIKVIVRAEALNSAPVADRADIPVPHETAERMVEALDKFTGVVSDEAGRKAAIFDYDWTLALMPKESAARWTLTKSTLDKLYQPERYKLFLEQKDTSGKPPQVVKTFQPPGGKKISFDAEVSDADLEYAAKWLLTAHGAPSTWGSGGPQIAGKTYYQFEIDLMREIDKHPQQAAILNKLHGFNGDIDSFAMRWAINAAEYEGSAKQLGVEAAPTGGQRVFPDKIEGQIIVEGYAYPGRENRIWFKKSNLQTAFLFEIIKTQWVVEKKKDETTWEKKNEPVETIEFNAREPDYFKYAFPEIGTFRINAFVNHNWFFPARITEEVEVKSEEQRLSQVKGAAFGGMGDPKVTKENKDFDTSLVDRFGKGKELEGNLPADWQRLSDDDRLKFITTDKDNLKKLIKQYDTPNAPYAYKHLVDYAKDRLKSIEEQEAKVAGEKKEGYVFFEARGAYLSRTDGVPDAPLKLLGMAKGEPEKMKLVIHDFTRLFDTTDFIFEAEGGGFSDAAEGAFLKMCKRYPAGRMSVLFENINNANVPQKNTIGFELDTNTVWKAVRSVVWDPTVTVVVNLAGAALIIFAPPTAAIVLPVLAIYNSIETVSKMSELEDGGSLTKVQFGKGVAEIGLNVLPVIGEFKALSIAAKAAAGAEAVSAADKLVLYGLNGATVAGMLVLMTAEGLEQCKALQEQDVSEVARLMAKLEEIRKRNPNSPEIASIEADLKKAQERALSRAEETFKNMAKSLALLLVPTAAMSKISKTLVGKSIATLIDEGKFVHQKGVPPHYDPIEGVMKGDRAKVNAEILEGLKSEFATDQGIKQAQLEKMAGTDKVEIRYSKGAKEVSVTTNRDTGITTIEAPEGTPFGKVLTEAYNNYFSKLEQDAQPGLRKPKPPDTAPPLTAPQRTMLEGKLKNLKALSAEDLHTLANLHPDALEALQNATPEELAKVAALVRLNREAEGLLRQYTYSGRKEQRKAGKPSAGTPSVADRLEVSLTNLAVTRTRGFPYGFESMAHFERFKQSIRAALTKFGLPTADIRVQGSSLHKLTPGDVDVAVVVDQTEYNRLVQKMRADISHSGILADFEKQWPGGHINSFYFPRLGTEQTFNQTVRGAAGTLGIDVSIVGPGGFDVDPYLKF